jgi:hypothetical protein
MDCSKMSQLLNSWVAATLRLIRPVLSILLVVIVWYICSTTEDLAQQETIIQSVIYMASTAVLFWFGDLAMRPKK